MNKKIKIIFVLTLLMLMVGIGEYGVHIAISHERQKEQSGEAEEIICSVDIEYLEAKGLQPFTSHLPVVMIDTKQQTLDKESDTWAKIGLYEDTLNGNDILALPDRVLDGTIKLRGASSYTSLDKNQYRLSFYKDESGKDYAYPLAGMRADSDWVLHGPFLDQTLMRNKLCYDLGKEMMAWAPDSRFIEVFRDGKYEGVYLAVETVSHEESRLALSEFGLLSGKTAYILKRDRIGTETNVIETWGQLHGKTGHEVSIDYPKTSKLTSRQIEWIRNDINIFEKNLYSGNANYENFIDIENFIDYFILNEVVLNNDAGKLSTYIYKELEGKLKLAIWDFNNAFDNYSNYKMDYESFLMGNAPWFDVLLKEENFVAQLVERYKQYRETTLSTPYLLEKVDTLQKELGDAIERNNSVWGYNFNMTLRSDQEEDMRGISNYEEAIAQLKYAIETRLMFMDEHITCLYKAIDVCDISH